MTRLTRTLYRYPNGSTIVVDRDEDAPQPERFYSEQYDMLDVREPVEEPLARQRLLTTNPPIKEEPAWSKH